MNINFDDHIKVKATIYEWRALKFKMQSVLNEPNSYPAPPTTILYYMWGYSFLSAFMLIFKKTVKLEMFNTKKEQTIKIPMQYIIAIHLTCRPLDTDPMDLARIIMNIDKALPIELKKALTTNY